VTLIDFVVVYFKFSLVFTIHPRRFPEPTHAFLQRLLADHE